MEKSIKDVFIDELQDIYSAELQIIKALPVMVTAAESPALKLAFSTHLKETKGQVVRLEKIFKLLKKAKKAKFCHGAQGLIEECKEVIKEYKKSFVRDAAIISKAQRIEHYEISAYGTMRSFANMLGMDEIADLLEATEDEEANADKLLSKIAEGGMFRTGINQKANTLENNYTMQRKNGSTISRFLTKMVPSKPKAKKKVVAVRARAKTVSVKSRGKSMTMKSKARSKSTARAKAKR